MTVPEVKTIIFDLDGVLADTDTGRFSVLGEILMDYGIDFHNEQVVENLAGISTLKFLQVHYPKLAEFHAEIVAERQKRFLSNLNKYCIPFPGSQEVVRNLSSYYSLYVATTNETAIAVKLLKHLGIHQYFKDVFGRNITEVQTDSLKNYKATLLELNISARDCIVIEDSIVGIRAAKKEDIFCIAFNPGGDKMVDELADASVKNFLELRRLLMNG